MNSTHLSIRWLLLTLAAIGLYLSSGCSDGKAKVSGTVTFDGQPVASGVATFVRKEGELVREGAIISQGSFQAVLTPGNYQVELNGQKVSGTRKQKGFDGKEEVLEITEELFPERYNSKTELVAEIKPGQNTLKYEAKAK